MKLFSLLDTQYNAFISNVNNYLSKTLSANNIAFGSSSIFGQIITIVGNAMQNIMLYIEDALVEQNKYTAQRKKSIYGLAALSGYEPNFGKAATLSIKLNFMPNNVTPYNVVINNKEGNIENSKVFFIDIVIIRMIKPIVILVAKRISSKSVGNGITIIITTMITPKTTNKS